MRDDQQGIVCSLSIPRIYSWPSNWGSGMITMIFMKPKVYYKHEHLLNVVPIWACTFGLGYRRHTQYLGFMSIILVIYKPFWFALVVPPINIILISERIQQFSKNQGVSFPSIPLSYYFLGLTNVHLLISFYVFVPCSYISLGIALENSSRLRLCSFSR
jgi:hypothetical protein